MITYLRCYVRHYVLLLFDFDDEVVAVRTISAGNDAEARKIALGAELAHMPSAGYQLWRQGKLLSGSFPTEAELPRGVGLVA
jgi:hypothetical protein